MTSFCHYPAWPIPFGLELPLEAEQPCPYLPGESSRYRAVSVETVPPSVYHRFMDSGFRRSGHVLYQPACRQCRACVPLRVPAAHFRPNASQRRCWRRNQDLTVTVAPPEATPQKLDLYNRYVTAWHQGPPLSGVDFADAFYASCVETLEFTYRGPQGDLLAVGLCDLAPESLSSVYFYFDPDARARSLGTFGALWELHFAARHGVPHYYLGFWVEGCSAMTYKANFRPYELLNLNGQWEPADPAGAGSAGPAL